MRKNKANGFLIACVHKDDSGEFRLHLNESIWGGVPSDWNDLDGIVDEVVYRNTEDLLKDGWTID